MQYMKLDSTQRDALLASLRAMPAYLRESFAGRAEEQIRTPGADGSFAPVEQVWHLADLERDGFAERIRRLLTEDDPALPDFDGARIAAERNYRSLSLADGLCAFAEARERNLAALGALDTAAWRRAGTQAGVGLVSLCDIPGFMLQHDTAHRAEIEAWKRHVGE